jgi:hypothetical protein
LPDVADAMDPLKLVALDRDDIEIISAHLQDAIVKVADVHWRPDENRFVAALGRFDWEAAYAEKPEYRRRLAALRFDRVLGCKCRSVQPRDKDAVLNLLAVEFAETDLGPCWTTGKCPEHAAEPPPPQGVDAPTTPRH